MMNKTYWKLDPLEMAICENANECIIVLAPYFSNKYLKNYFEDFIYSLNDLKQINDLYYSIHI